MSRPVAVLAAAVAVFAGARVAAAESTYSCAGGTGSASFSTSASSACLYTATVRVERLRVVAGDRLESAELSAVMRESNQYCNTRPLGTAHERYHFTGGRWDGHTLRLMFAGVAGDAARNDMVFTGMLRGDEIDGDARFARQDCTDACNWTVTVHQKLVLAKP